MTSSDRLRSPKTSTLPFTLKPVTTSTHSAFPLRPRSTDILEGAVNRLFERKALLLICTGLRRAGLAEAHQEDERDSDPSQSDTTLL
jgi:hypothetical protein